ncbi:unnamed protein product [Durusdinium trenchii]|uniref:Ribosome biogenesis protein NOP53 n=1 Tax=Durusdinium trenchii TaxID=1381693 RepID=A0ABP0QV11_9DINO
MDDDEEDEGDADPDGSRKAVFDQAIAAMKEKNAKAKPEEDEDEEEEDVTTLDHSGVLSQLLDDGGGELMNSFAGSRLEGASNEKKKTLTKRQQKQREMQDDLVRRLREAELMESFLTRSGHKRPVSLEVVEKLLSDWASGNIQMA